MSDAEVPEAVAVTISEWLQNISNDGRGTTPELDDLLQYDYKSAMWATLVHHGRKIGTLTLLHRESDVYNDDHLRLLKSIAKQAALAIRNAQLHRELRDYAENLEEMVRQRTAELQDAQAGLIRSEKLASLGRLSAGIAHEINNPLQPLLTCLNMAIEDLTDGNPIDLELLQVAEQSVRRIRKITQELLTFAKEGDDEYQEIQLNKLLEETFILTRKQMQHADIKLETDLRPLPPVYALPDRLQQVFVNMMLNAIEAMPTGGVLHIGTQASGDFVVVFFEDTGVGIAPENKDRLFEPFFSTKGENGTGLGLSVSYGIIDSHGGTIQFESEMDKGTTFYIWIPVTQQASISLPENLSIST